jgi:hypothetical protein
MRVTAVHSPLCRRFVGLGVIALVTACSSDRISTPSPELRPHPKIQMPELVGGSLKIASTLRARLADPVMGPLFRSNWKAEGIHGALSPEEMLQSLERPSSSINASPMASYAENGSPTSDGEASAMTSGSSIMLLWDGQWGVDSYSAFPAILDIQAPWEVSCGYYGSGSGCTGSVYWATGWGTCSRIGMSCHNNEYFQPPPCGGAARYQGLISATHDFSWAYFNYRRASSSKEVCESRSSTTAGGGGGGDCWDVFAWWIDGSGYHEKYLFSFCSQNLA